MAKVNVSESVPVTPEQAWSAVADLAEPQLLGRYMAFSSSSWQIGFFIGPAIGGFVLQHKPLALWPAAAAICVLASAYALVLERRIPAHLHLTPHGDSLAGVPGTMTNMVPATDDPLSTDAQPAPHPADEASRVQRGGHTAPGTARR